METLGCPLYVHPANLRDNRNCVLCQVCTKACGHYSVELQLRPPAFGIWSGEHEPVKGEVALMLLLLAAPYLHHSDEILGQFGMAESQTSLWTQIALCSGLLAMPGLWFLGTDLLGRSLSLLRGVPRRAVGLGKEASRKNSFTTLAYSVLPLCLSGNLAHYLPFLLREGFMILPVAARSIGFDDGLFMPHFQVSEDVTSFLQTLTLIGGLASTEVLALRLTRGSPAPLRYAHLAFPLAVTACYWPILIKGLPFLEF